MNKSKLPSREEMEKIVAHYGKSETEGEYDSLAVGEDCTLGEVRKALHSDSHGSGKAKRK